MFPFGLACGGSLPPHGSRMASVMPFPCSACDTCLRCKAAIRFVVRFVFHHTGTNGVFQPFQAVRNPKSPVFVTTKAGEPLIAQRLTRPNKPRCLSAGPLRPPSAYRIRGSAARAPVRLRHGDVTRGAHHGFAIEGEAIAHDVFVGVGIVFGSIILVVIVAVLSRRGILVGVILTVLVGIVGIFSSVAIVVSIVRIAGFAVIGCRARIAIRHSIRAIFAGMVVSIAVLSRCSTICRYVSVLSRRLPNRLPFLLLLLIRLFRLIARLPLFRHRLRRLFRLRLRLQLRLRLFVRWLLRFAVVRKALCVVIVRCGLSGNILPGNVGNVRSDCVFSIGLLCRFRLARCGFGGHVAAIRHRFVGERGRAGSRGAGQHRNRDKQCGEFSHPRATPAYEAGKRVLHPLHDMSISHGAVANCLCASMP